MAVKELLYKKIEAEAGPSHYRKDQQGFTGYSWVRIPEFSHDDTLCFSMRNWGFY